MDFNIRQLLAGIGVLLFGMSIFEQALNFLGGKKLKVLLQKHTKTGWMAIWTGTWTTTVMQSSSLVSLLILAFVGAGVMQLSSAIGVIFGANIGSPMLPLLASLIGFGEFNISTLAFPLIAIGGFGMIFLKSEKRLRAARLLVGFGLLFIGLDWMKDSVAVIKDTFDLTQYKNMSLWGFGVLGILVTIVIQSSGALGIMSLAALDGGIITFPASIAIAVGSNLGTTVTAVLGSLGGKRIKRQVALSHIMVNVGATVFGIIFFWQYIRLVNVGMGLENNPVIGSAVWNVVYNASTSILFGFFLIPFTKMIKWMLPDEKSEKKTLHIDSLIQVQNQSFATPALLALAEDSKTLLKNAHEYLMYIYGLDNKNIIEGNSEKESGWVKEDHIALYDQNKEIANKLLALILRIKQFKMNEDASKQLHNIETSVYSALKSMKAIKNIHRDILDFRESSDSLTKSLYQQIKTMQVHVSRTISMIHEDNVNNYEKLISASEGLKKYHQAFVATISDKETLEHLNEEATLPTLINLNHYVYEANEMILLAFANTYLTHEQTESFETTQDIDEEIYESFTTD